MSNSCKTALITGAAGGIGRKLVDIFMEADYQVIATDVYETAHDLFSCPYLVIDLERFAEDSAYADSRIPQVLGLLDNQGLDVLINNAAIQILGDVNSLTRADWRKSLDVNLIAPFLLTQSLILQLEKAAGCVINVSSIHARLTKKNFVAYATSKAALSGMTRAMAVDLGERVRVNAIEPAAIDTPMLAGGFLGQPELYRSLQVCHPQNRIGTPADVAELALVIADSRMSFLHGACIPLGGGIDGRLHDPF